MRMVLPMREPGVTLGCTQTQPSRSMRGKGCASLRGILMALLLAFTADTQALARDTGFPAMSEEALAPRIAPNGYDVTVIVFSDYNCSYCRRLQGALAQLLARDRKIRVVWRDWPILGEISLLAARAAIASQWQGRHRTFHDALFAQPGRLTETSIQAAARAAGLDWARLRRDMAARAHDIDTVIARSDAGARMLQFEGTPGLVIGNARLGGAASLEELQEAVAVARKDGVG